MTLKSLNCKCNVLIKETLIELFEKVFIFEFHHLQTKHWPFVQIIPNTIQNKMESSGFRQLPKPILIAMPVPSIIPISIILGLST